MAKDFFGDDVLQRDSSFGRTRDSVNGIPVKPISDSSLTRMVKQKEEMKNQAADAMKEIEHLRLRQEQLEKDKTDLEQLTRRQDEYERGKRDITEKLVQGIMVFEKEETEAMRIAELLAVMRARFKDTLAEVQSIDESRWNDGDFQLELNKAMVIVEDARAIYKKAFAKIQASGWQKDIVASTSSSVLNELPKPFGQGMKWGEWMKAGLAFSVPFMVFLGFILLIYLWASGWLSSPDGK